MEKKTVSILTIIAGTILCCLPDIAGLCFGSLALAGSFLPGGAIPTEDSFQVAGVAVMILGLSLVLLAIPLGAAIWYWRKQKLETAQMQQLRIPDEDF